MQPVDLTGIGAVTTVYDRTLYTGSMYLIVGPSIGAQTASAALSSGVNQETSLDVSAFTGLHYVGFYIHNGVGEQSAGYIHKLALEA